MASFLMIELFKSTERDEVESTAISAELGFAAYDMCETGSDVGCFLIGCFESVDGGVDQGFKELDLANVAGWSLVFHQSTLVCGSARNIVLFDVSVGTLNWRGVLRGHTWLVVGLAAHGDWLASGSCDGTMRIWSMTTRKQLHCETDHTSELKTLCCNGRWLVSGNPDESVIVYDATRDFARHTTLTLNAMVEAVCFSPDDSMLAVAARYGCSAIYSVGTFERLHTLADNHTVWSVAWLGNDAGLLVGASNGELVVWNASTGHIVSQETGFNGNFSALLFSSSFQSLLTGTDRAMVLVFTVVLHAQSRATAALYRASLVIFAAFRRSKLGMFLMQRVAEALAGGGGGAATLESLSDGKRARIFRAACVSLAERRTRAVTFDALSGFHARMHWLHTSTPVYKHAQLASIGPDAAAPPTPAIASDLASLSLAPSLFASAAAAASPENALIMQVSPPLRSHSRHHHTNHHHHHHQRRRRRHRQ